VEIDVALELNAARRVVRGIPARRLLAERVVVVFDVLRATSCIVTALANGARAVVPVLTPQQGKRVRQEYGGEALLCGERRGVKIPGFDLANSPREFTRKVVQGKTLVMTTTNGTRAIKCVSGARCVIMGALHNLSAVGRVVSKVPQLWLVCAGTKGAVSIEDVAAAGALIRCIQTGSHGEQLMLTDAAHLALSTFQANKHTLAELLRNGAHGRYLAKLGFEDDIRDCAQADTTNVVPVMDNKTGEIRPYVLQPLS
jgi:2-phosphosulfolactate phosphatase